MPLAGNMYTPIHTQARAHTCTLRLPCWETFLPGLNQLFLIANIFIKNNILDVGSSPSAWQLLFLAGQYEMCSSPEIRHLKLRTQNLANLLG